MPGQVDSTLVMLSPGEIATREGVSKQAISKTVKALLDGGHELPVERDGRGRVIRVSLAHLDHLRGRYSDSAKVKAGRKTKPDLFEGGEEGAEDDDSRDEAMRRQAWLRLQREQLDHNVEMGQLLRTDKYDDALLRAGRAIQADISRLQNYADDVALAVSKEGTSGARMTLRKISAEIAARISERLASIAANAPREDEPIADEAAAE